MSGSVGSKDMNDKQIALLKSYLRSIAVAVVSVYTAGQRDWKALGAAALIAAIAPVIAWLDPKDTRFGRGAN